MTCNFSIKHYIETLEQYRDNGYHIGTIGGYLRGERYNKHLLLRHDVDLSLHYALEMALLEKDHGIHSTYFILLTSDLYSAVSPSGRASIKAIKEAGHEIALHIDSRYFLGTSEFNILSQIAETTVSTWCRHLVNVTEPLDMPRDASKIPYKYLSDSGMNWREKCWCNHINEHYTMQVLIHPEWHTVSPTGKRTKFEILEDVKEESKGILVQGFRQFREVLSEYIQQVNNEAATMRL